ncbi:MAG: CAP domain-containing protein [Chloroflexota bacterium]
MKNIKAILVAVCLFVLASLLIHIQAEEGIPEEQIPDLMSEINLWRLNSGLEPVVYNSVLESMAVAQADFVMSLPSLPVDLHAGTNGEDVRQRSQYDTFAWPTYGHPEFITVTEITAIGSIRSAMNFWMNSDIHTRSALNPNYREVGIATRMRGTDIMFVVVLAGRPDILPALADPDLGDLYLTNERNEWGGGDWIGEVTDYRLLDGDRQPIADWQPWEPRIDLPEVSGDTFFIQYRDANDHRTTSEVFVNPVWSSRLQFSLDALQDAAEAANTTPTATATEGTEVEAVSAFPTNTPQGNSPFATNTPIPTPTLTLTPSITPSPLPTFTPTATFTPVPPQAVNLVYDDRYITLLNQSGTIVDLFGLEFRKGDYAFASQSWEVPADEVNISALRPTHCLQIGGFTVSNTVLTLDGCGFVRSLVTISEDNFFWIEGTFDVVVDDEVIITCEADAGLCSFIIER